MKAVVLSPCIDPGPTGRPVHEFFFITMMRQHSQYDSRLGFSFMVLDRVRVRVRLWLG